MRVAWLTDIHLNFLDGPQLRAWEELVAAANPQALLITGDIAEAHNLSGYLRGLAQRLPCPVHFVLGNHDFYRSSVASVRPMVAALCAELPQLNYLTISEVVELTPRVGLVGHDGWADGRAGDFFGSDIMLNDYRLIAELADLSPLERFQALNRLGDEAGEHARRVLPAALERYEQVVVLTHPPPYRESCWYEGRVSNDNWSPHMTCVALGEALREVVSAYPQRQVTVLCGHTHGAGETRILDNLLVLTGGAEYGELQVQRVFEFD